MTASLRRRSVPALPLKGKSPTGLTELTEAGRGSRDICFLWRQPSVISVISVGEHLTLRDKLLSER